MSLKKVANICCLAAFAAGCNSAMAQTIDYGSLEMLFGEPVTTSATGQPQRVSEAPVTMQIITADEIRRSGANNIADVLRMHSSMSVWQWTRLTQDVSVRGYNQAFAPRLLTLINGRQVYAEVYGQTIWENMPVQLEEIRQIEIVEGPNSALFGFNAVGGVVNIITYNPMYDDVSSVGVRVGTNNYRQGHMVHTQKFGDKVALRVSGGAIKADEFDDSSKNTVSFYNPKSKQIMADGIVQLTEDSQLRFEVTETNAKTNEYPKTYGSTKAQYDTHSVKATYTADTDIGIVRANIYRNGLILRANNGNAGGSNINNKNEVIVAQLEDTMQIGTSHIARMQAEYRNNVMHGTDVISSDAELSYDNYALSGMWNWKICGQCAWTNALRVDHLQLKRTGSLIANSVLTSNSDYDQQLTEVSYNSGLVWSPNGSVDTFRIMTARGIQTPSLMDYGTEVDIGSSQLMGDPRLNPGVITNYEIGYDRRIDDIKGMFRSSVFYQKTKDLIAFGGKTTGTVKQTSNIGSTDIVGLEIELNGKYGDYWDWDVGYTIQEANDDLTVNHGSSLTVPYDGEAATPLHTFNLHLGYADGPWEVDGYAQYVSKYKTLANTGMGTGYTYWDAGDSVNMFGRVGYKILDNTTIALSGSELTNSDTTETSGPEKERQVFLSLTTTF